MSYWFVSHAITLFKDDSRRVANIYTDLSIDEQIKAVYSPRYTCRFMTPYLTRHMELRAPYLRDKAIRYRAGWCLHKRYKLLIFDAELDDNDSIEYKLLKNENAIVRDVQEDYEFLTYLDNGRT